MSYMLLRVQELLSIDVVPPFHLQIGPFGLPNPPKYDELELCYFLFFRGRGTMHIHSIAQQKSPFDFHELYYLKVAYCTTL